MVPWLAARAAGHRDAAADRAGAAQGGAAGHGDGRIAQRAADDQRAGRNVGRAGVAAVAGERDGVAAQLLTPPVPLTGRAKVKLSARLKASVPLSTTPLVRRSSRWCRRCQAATCRR